MKKKKKINNVLLGKFSNFMERPVLLIMRKISDLPVNQQCRETFPIFSLAKLLFPAARTHHKVIHRKHTKLESEDSLLQLASAIV